MIYTTTITCIGCGWIYPALKQEAAKSRRFAAEIKKAGKDVIVKIEAEDATALKAITTSMLHLIETAEKIHNGW